MITVLVAVRGPATRARLEGAVGGSRTIRLVSAPSSGSLARQVRALRPDLVLLDLEGQPVEAALAELAEPAEAAGPSLVVLADPPRRLLVDVAMDRGPIRAVLPRDATSGEILAAVEAVAAGLVTLHPDVLGVLRSRAPRPTRPAPDADRSLTAREIEVLGMLAEGLGNKLIAARLTISTHTVKFHVASILAKLGAGSRTEAVTIGMRRGLVVI
jgi:NarL family two-component system response regulator YdfI